MHVVNIQNLRSCSVLKVDLHWTGYKAERSVYTTIIAGRVAKEIRNIWERSV